MARTYYLHPKDPQPDRLDRIVQALRAGAVILYPTDTAYAIGCDLASKAAIERVQRIKRLSNNKPLTFLCPSLSNVATYARVSDSAYRLMRHLIPGPYTFLLPATRVLPKMVLDPKRRTTGIRVPDNRLCQALLAGLANPLISTTARLSDGSAAQYDYELFESLDPLVDLILEIDPIAAPPTTPGQVSTVIDLTGDEPVIVREGLGWERAAAFV
ncbi:L-threonylcarbamoyladenylate synthase [Gloeobacter kilaueensis]|uniref:Sua5/YciO/YrdC/YwlC family protein n=1 Tax=Gloeobacter kilaueensis (strain ATCC BAA-2537 / CCAP 1431/1 / ULC 316 / JS1) TaxID=1183438 RepID=U5QGG3_GLOK1|nr:L-threonylcarbamoyladenylate synthase [Gloeobacter kilaueensis]AGY56755.1 Sua5/YciO/YrdC/YwlC family protein [Gloeobacter kilaueensis JS1]